ncbi:uncharacterized protein BJ171DRAFT_566008 [Polychytrium aggregatum]|uniref:uncharacterized protein n=1 Tax=Polychytrium aggregatum TaxID=110093 RepID=UPI0022FE253A|nr:uncharacterized protein BJ171DRAFT_566008 [Polychytrium aggregatum]KAI9207164.1 hypothetical protein BJ171DRAFT_566008 [Polychytrium aggregatum]
MSDVHAMIEPSHGDLAANPLLTDPIIKQLLQNRGPATDVTESFEHERQLRMYNMLRHSNHYKRAQVADANFKWANDLNQALDDMNMSDVSIAEFDPDRSVACSVTPVEDPADHGRRPKVEARSTDTLASDKGTAGPAGLFCSPGPQEPAERSNGRLCPGASVEMRVPPHNKGRRVSFSQKVKAYQEIEPEDSPSTLAALWALSTERETSQSKSSSHPASLPTIGISPKSPVLLAVSSDTLSSRRGSLSGSVTIETEIPLRCDDGPMPFMIHNHAHPATIGSHEGSHRTITADAEGLILKQSTRAGTAPQEETDSGRLSGEHAVGQKKGLKGLVTSTLKKIFHGPTQQYCSRHSEVAEVIPVIAEGPMEMWSWASRGNCGADSSAQDAWAAALQHLRIHSESTDLPTTRSLASPLRAQATSIKRVSKSLMFIHLRIGEVPLAAIAKRANFSDSAQSELDHIHRYLRVGDSIECEGPLEWDTRTDPKKLLFRIESVKIVQKWNVERDGAFQIEMELPPAASRSGLSVNLPQDAEHGVISDPQAGSPRDPQDLQPDQQRLGERGPCKFWINTGRCPVKNCIWRHEEGEALQRSKRAYLHDRLKRRRIELPASQNDPIPSAAKASHHSRAQVFARWIVETFSPTTELNLGMGVLDVAGGRGDVSFELANGFAVRSTLIEPRAVMATKRQIRAQRKREEVLRTEQIAGAEHDEHHEDLVDDDGAGDNDDADDSQHEGDQRQISSPSSNPPQPKIQREAACEYGNRDDINNSGNININNNDDININDNDGININNNDDININDNDGINNSGGVRLFQHVQQRFDLALQDPLLEARLRMCSMLVGMHPDQATEGIVDAALAWGRPFAVVPCCVFAKEFPGRRLRSGAPVSTVDDLVAYLCEKADGIQTAHLPFHGRNLVVYRLK